MKSWKCDITLLMQDVWWRSTSWSANLLCHRRYYLWCCAFWCVSAGLCFLAGLPQRVLSTKCWFLVVKNHKSALPPSALAPEAKLKDRARDSPTFTSLSARSSPRCWPFSHALLSFHFCVRRQTSSRFWKLASSSSSSLADWMSFAFGILFMVPYVHF